MAEFPFEEGAGNKLFVEVEIGKSGPLWFVLDTGAATTYLDLERAQALGIPLLDQRTVSVGAGSGQVLQTARASKVEIEVHGERFTKAEMPALELRQVAEIMGRRVDGLLGNDFIGRFAFEIDYQQKRIRLREAATFEYRGEGEIVEVDLESGRPMIRAGVTLAGQPIDVENLVVDTGANASLYLGRAVVEKHGLLPPGTTLASGVISRGAGGATRGAVARVDRIQIGGLAFPGPVAIFSQDTEGFFADERYGGIVGGELLRRTRVIFDFTRNRMILEPKDLAQPFVYDRSGLLILARAPDFDRFEIASVLRGTPGEKANLREGDRILEVAGRAAGKLTLRKITEQLKQREGTEVPLTIEREGQKMDVVVVLRNYWRGVESS